MKIYLDIDGVILANGGHAAIGAKAFLKCVIRKYRGNVYWLSTHNVGGRREIDRVLRGAFSKRSLSKIMAEIKIAPYDYYDDDRKTSAIDFSEPFAWLDDDLSDDEKSELLSHGALKNHIMIRLDQNPKQLIDLMKEKKI